MFIAFTYVSISFAVDLVFGFVFVNAEHLSQANANVTNSQFLFDISERQFRL